jgi:hypothetical protein
MSPGSTFRPTKKPSKRGKSKIVHRYRWIHDVPLRDGKDALKVNWFEIEILTAVK